MTDLTDLLDRASDLRRDADADRRRPRPGAAALRRRRRRQGLVTVGSLCALGVIAGGGRTRRARRAPARAPDGAIETPDEACCRRQRDRGGPTRSASCRVGWEVQGSYPQGVTIAPIGFPDQEPASFVGKLVIMYDQNPLVRRAHGVQRPRVLQPRRGRPRPRCGPHPSRGARGRRLGAVPGLGRLGRATR